MTREKPAQAVHADWDKNIHHFIAFKANYDDKKPFAGISLTLDKTSSGKHGIKLYPVLRYDLGEHSLYHPLDPNQDFVSFKEKFKKQWGAIISVAEKVENHKPDYKQLREERKHKW